MGQKICFMHKAAQPYRNSDLLVENRCTVFHSLSTGLKPGVGTLRLMGRD